MNLMLNLYNICAFYLMIKWHTLITFEFKFYNDEL